LDVELVKPCVSDPDLYTVHGDVETEVDLEDVRDRLPEGAKCVPDLGVARFELEGGEVTLYEDGMFDARQVDGRQDAEEKWRQLTDLVESRTDISKR